MSQAPRERLNRLLDLASRGLEGRAALLDELADLLLDWPADYAVAMRAPFEALFEKTAREADARTRATVARRLDGHDELPVSLLNEFYFEAPAGMRARILALNEALDADAHFADAVDATSLVEAARTMNGAFAGAFAGTLSLPPAIAKEILADTSGQSLAVACSGAGLDRAAFSAIALLTSARPDPSRLTHFDTIPKAGAERLLDFWRGRGL
jgi:hypothetical protein